MPVDKIGNINQTISAPIAEQKQPEQQKTVEEVDKGLSDSAKFMIGATALAATIAVGIIGHKNNWWRKAVKEGENLASSSNVSHTQPNPKPPTEPLNLPNSTNQAVERQHNVAPTHSVDLKSIKTVEAAAAEFERVAAREIEELPANKAIIEEALAERARFIVDNPTSILDAEGIAYKVKNNCITVFDKAGKPTKKIYFNLSQNEGWGKGLAVPPSPTLIEYINPETGKLVKVHTKTLGQPETVRLFGENGSVTKELFCINEKTLVVKDYSKAGNIPDKVSVFNMDNNTMRSCLEFNSETGYPSVAYAQGHIYTPRKNSTPWFDNISESSPEHTKIKGLGDLFGCNGSSGVDFIMPRLTKNGCIVENGNINFNPHRCTLLDFATHEQKYFIDIRDNDFIVQEFDTKTLRPIKTLWMENGKIIANKFGKSPKEVLEEMKEIFTDLTPDMYSEHTTKLPELIQELISKLA